MKTTCLEEHVATPGIIAAWQALDPLTRDLAIDKSSANDKERRLRDLVDRFHKSNARQSSPSRGIGAH